jgi:hypothetical protein
MDRIISNEYGPGIFLGFFGNGLQCLVSVRRPLKHDTDAKLLKMFGKLRALEGQELQDALAECRKKTITANMIVMTSSIRVDQEP